MHIEDIREYIMQINDDVAELRHLCQVDKMASKLCSSRSYWDKIFKSHHLQMPTTSMTSPESWLVAYEKELIIQFKINKLFKILSNPSPEDFYIDNDVGDESLYISHKLPFYLINFNETINKEWSKWLILKSKNLTSKGKFNNTFAPPQIMIETDKNHYKITFQFSHNDQSIQDYDYIVSKQIVYDLFHIALSCDVRIYNASNNDVKY